RVVGAEAERVRQAVHHGRLSSAADVRAVGTEIQTVTAEERQHAGPAGLHLQDGLGTGVGRDGVAATAKISAVGTEVDAAAAEHRIHATAGAGTDHLHNTLRAGVGPDGATAAAEISAVGAEVNAAAAEERVHAAAGADHLNDALQAVVGVNGI